MLRHILEDFVMWPRAIAYLDLASNSAASGLTCLDPSRAIQSQKEEADINTIVRNFGVTGKLPQGVRVPSYGDFSGVEDYQEALAAIRDADASFMAMPASVRDRFGNNPARFVEFCSDSANLEEMRKLGLAVAAPVAENPGASA